MIIMFLGALSRRTHPNGNGWSKAPQALLTRMDPNQFGYQEKKLDLVFIGTLLGEGKEKEVMIEYWLLKST